MNRPQRLIDQTAYVARELPGVICHCGATLATIAEVCTAGLAETCQGFDAVEAKRAEFGALRVETDGGGK